MLKKQEKRIRRHNRVRAKISGTTERPRLCVFRSASHIHAQLVDDDKGRTVLSLSDVGVKKPKAKKDNAYEVGKEIAKLAIEKKIKEVVFDRGGYKYHGRVKALADGAREGGLKF